MKKVVVVLSILLLVFLAGCNYKINTAVREETSLVDEIARVEEELSFGAEGREAAEAVEDTVEEAEDSTAEEDVILPDLQESVQTSDEEMQVIAVNEDEMVRLSVKINDPDQDSVEYSFTPPLNKQGQWKTNYGDAGEYVVTLSASDGRLTTEKKIKIIVKRVNVPPVINGVTNLQVKEGETVSFKPVINDPNKDLVTVVVSEPLKSGTFKTDHTSAGEYQIVVTASDGELETEKIFTLVVDDVNELPELTGIADLNVKEGEVVKVEPKVIDLDGDEVTLTISEPVGDDGTWETGYTDHGEYFVTVTANDGKGIVTKIIKVVVEDVNMPPEIVGVSLAAN